MKDSNDCIAMTALGLSGLVHFFCMGQFFSDIIKKRKSILNFVPALYLFCVFLWFGVLANQFSALKAVLYLMALLAFHLMMNTLYHHFTKDYPQDGY